MARLTKKEINIYLVLLANISSDSHKAVLFSVMASLVLESKVGGDIMAAMKMVFNLCDFKKWNGGRLSRSPYWILVSAERSLSPTTYIRKGPNQTPRLDTKLNFLLFCSLLSKSQVSVSSSGPTRLVLCSGSLPETALKNRTTEPWAWWIAPLKQSSRKCELIFTKTYQYDAETLCN